MKHKYRKARDHTTLHKKIQLRKFMLEKTAAEIAVPVVIEAYGGEGEIFLACYRDVLHGAVFELDKDAVIHLASQRPTWSVYQADCVDALSAGAAAHLEANILDVDPWGDPWPAIRAFFESERPRACVVYVVVNDGLRDYIQFGQAWRSASVKHITRRYGNDFHPVYLDICKEMMGEVAEGAGYSLAGWVGYYCGSAKRRTHYLARLERQPELAAPLG